MCRMMGVVSRGPVYYDLFEEFADLATQGMCPLGAPDERGHKDGWGLACFRNGALTLHMRDAGSAVDASRYYGTAWKIAKLNLERAAGHAVIDMSHQPRRRQRRGDDDRGFRAHSRDARGTDAPRGAPYDYVRPGTPEDDRIVEA